MSFGDYYHLDNLGTASSPLAICVGEFVWQHRHFRGELKESSEIVRQAAKVGEDLLDRLWDTGIVLVEDHVLEQLVTGHGEGMRVHVSDINEECHPSAIRGGFHQCLVSTMTLHHRLIELLLVPDGRQVGAISIRDGATCARRIQVRYAEISSEATVIGIDTTGVSPPYIHLVHDAMLI